MDFGLPPEYLRLLVLVHLVVSASMTGAVWFNHFVHYALMRRVPPERFAAYMEEHIARFTRWILPPMLFEMATAIALLLLGAWESMFNFVVLSGAWAFTGYLRPIYQQLSEGHKPELLDRLIRLDRARTGLWLAHLLVASMMALKVFFPV